MESLIPLNRGCADCGDLTVSSVDLHHCVFLCPDCAAVHKDLNFPVRPLSGHFHSVELLQLSQLGNCTVNLKLCGLPKPWFPSPEQFPYQAVRRMYIQAKYKWLLFAGEAESLEGCKSLEEYWFYIDEVSEETPSVQGPVSLSVLRTAHSYGDSIRKETFVWHPVLGAKWLALQALHPGLISFPGSASDEEVCRFYEMRRHLTRQRAPHLRGPLECQSRGKLIVKWLILLNISLSVNTLTQEVIPESTYSLSNTHFNLVEKAGKLGILAVSPGDEFTLWAESAFELLEWFTELRHTQYMLKVLGVEDFPLLPVPAADQHICNVRSSRSYMGVQVKEGYLRKEGSLFKTVKTRWFVLYSTGLFYYENARCKAFIRKIPLQEARIWTIDDYRYPHHFTVLTDTRTLHLWADDAESKNVWVRDLKRVISHFPTNSPDL